jgi:hypothetical protein
MYMALRMIKHSEDEKVETYCNQKREGPKTHSTLTAFNEPRRPCSPNLLHTVQTSENTQHTNCLLTLLDERHKIKTIQVPCIPHNNRASFTISISCLAHSHRSQSGKLFHYITDYVHSPKAQARFPIKCSQKHQIPSAV